jgi:hypothetical protein
MTTRFHAFDVEALRQMLEALRYADSEALIMPGTGNILPVLIVELENELAARDRE